MKIVVPSNVVNAVLQFCDPKDSRPALRGVLFEVRRDSVTLVATNNYILGAYRVEGDFDVSDVDVIVPHTLLKHVNGAGYVEVEFDAPKPACNITINYNGVAVAGASIDEQFPAWRKAVPRKTSGEVAQFDPALLNTIAKAWTALFGRKIKPRPLIAHNGDKAAIVNINLDKKFLVLLMPINDRLEPSVEPPAWAVVND